MCKVAMQRGLKKPQQLGVPREIARLCWQVGKRNPGPFCGEMPLGLRRLEVDHLDSHSIECSDSEGRCSMVSIVFAQSAGAELYGPDPNGEASSEAGRQKYLLRHPQTRL